MKRAIRVLYSSTFLLLLALLVNVGIYVLFSIYVSPFAYLALLLVGVVFSVLILNRTGESAIYKFLWFVIILIFPLFGIMLYLHMKTKRGTRHQRKNWQSITYNSSKYLEQNLEIVDTLKKTEVAYANVNRYLLNFENMPVYQNSMSQYVASGEDYFKQLFADIKQAKKYILLEYFIIKPGKVWDELFELLRLKARDGVEIRLIYDDLGCLNTFKDRKLFDKLENHGIKAVPFNKVQAGLNLFVNYRDHRKLAIVDGRVAYVGGVNIGDEYANVVQKHGYWKDSAVKVIGPAVWNNIVMFFNSWILSCKEEIDFSRYVPNITDIVPAKNKEFIQPYGTGPLTMEAVNRNLVLKMINTAKDYVYITTPYFILDAQMLASLKLASNSGVEVKIIMPANSDKQWLQYLSRSYYEGLIKAGIQIYEYTPGFMHAKMLLSDGEQALVGTANFDFRSLYLHFENGVLLSNSKTVGAVKFDFDAIINASHLMSLRDLKQRKWYEKFLAQFLKVFAPLV